MKLSIIFLLFITVFIQSCSGKRAEESDLVYGRNLIESCLGHPHTFFPKHDTKVEVGEMSAFSGVNETRFNEILDHVQRVYAPIFRDKGGELKVIKNWESADVNAMAWSQGDRKNIEFYGGLARHHNATEDMLYLIACHEIGHHLGGAPRYSGLEGLFCGSSEGQSDYFATLKCMRKIFKEENNSVSGVFPEAISLCEGKFSSQSEENLCVRSVMAGYASASMSYSLQPNRSAPPALWAKDHTIVDKTYESHPQAQCRLDTYIEGAICEVSENEELTTNANDGVCSRFKNHNEGTRPLCWYKPYKI